MAPGAPGQVGGLAQRDAHRICPGLRKDSEPVIMPSIMPSTILGILASGKVYCAAFSTSARPAMVGPALPPFGGAGPWPSPGRGSQDGSRTGGKGMGGHAFRDCAAADDRVYRVHP